MFWHYGIVLRGGSDTITKLLCHNVYDPPCDTPQSHAIGRMFLLSAVIIHRLHHFFTAKQDLDGYPSLRHFRNAANKRCTFHDTLLLIVHCIKDRYKARAVSPMLSSQVMRGTRTRSGDTTMTEVKGKPITGKTPQKNVKYFYENEAACNTDELLRVHNRMKHCRGIPVFRVNPKTKERRGEGAQGYCVECKRRTNVFCINCKKWLCNVQLPVNRTTEETECSDANMIDSRYVSITFENEKITGKKQNICAIYSCWHKSHQACLEKEGVLVRMQQGDIP
jgi:hypothetical protein